MTDEEQADHATLLRLVRLGDQIIWLLVKQAGGKVTIDRTTLDDFNPAKATLVYGSDPVSGGSTIEAIE